MATELTPLPDQQPVIETDIAPLSNPARPI
jgi:hypothetical protein